MAGRPAGWMAGSSWPYECLQLALSMASEHATGGLLILIEGAVLDAREVSLDISTSKAVTRNVRKHGFQGLVSESCIEDTCRSRRAPHRGSLRTSGRAACSQPFGIISYVAAMHVNMPTALVYSRPALCCAAHASTHYFGLT